MTHGSYYDSRIKNSLTESFDISLKRAFQLIHILVLFFNEINQIKRYVHIWAIFISVECKRTFPERDKLSPLLFHFQSFWSRSRLKRAPPENVQLDFISLLTSGTSSQTGLALCWSTLARSGLPQWGSICGRWHYWSRMIACCLLHWSKNYFNDQNESFFIRDKYSHLAICLRLLESHYW